MLIRDQTFLIAFGMMVSMIAFLGCAKKTVSLEGYSHGEALGMGYHDQKSALERIKQGFNKEEVTSILGTPDRIEGKDPDQSWYDELWIYDFQKFPDYPKGHKMAVWEGQVMFLEKKVVHTRKITWLESR